MIASAKHGLGHVSVRAATESQGYPVDQTDDRDNNPRSECLPFAVCAVLWLQRSTNYFQGNCSKVLAYRSKPFAGSRGVCCRG